MREQVVPVPGTIALLFALAGAVIGPLLVRLGLRQLRWTQIPRWGRPLSAALGATAAGSVACLAPGRIDSALIPAVAVWGLALAALAVCDAVAMRIPTPLVRQSTTAALLLLTIGAAIADAWVTWAVGLGGAAVVAGVFTAASRRGGTGKGDIRLGLLGGLGLGFVSVGGLVAGLAAWTTVVTTQAAVAHLRGGSLRTHIPLTPGLTAGLFVAALFPS